MESGSQKQDKTGAISQSGPDGASPKSAHSASASKSREAATNRKEGADRRRRRPSVKLFAILTGLLLVVGGIYYYVAGSGVETTDDAYTEGSVIMIAPQVAGRVISVEAGDNAFIRAGSPILHIDPQQYQIAVNSAQAALATVKADAAGSLLALDIARKNYPAILDQAKAQLQTAQANLAKAKADFDRQTGLRRDATTQQDIDAARAAYLQAQAQLESAQAQVEQASPVQARIETASAVLQGQQSSVDQAQAKLDAAQLDLSHTVVVAPQDGWITNKSVESGDYVVPGQQLTALVTPDVWVTASFKESQLAVIKPGQKVDIEVDAYPDLKLEGHVDSIQLGSGSKFSVFPPENATGNFVKIVQRVPVKILIDSGLDPKHPLPLGLSVTPTVHVK